jgi:hypothetical protein
MCQKPRRYLIGRVIATHSAGIDSISEAPALSVLSALGRVMLEDVGGVADIDSSSMVVPGLPYMTPPGVPDSVPDAALLLSKLGGAAKGFGSALLATAGSDPPARTAIGSNSNLLSCDETPCLPAAAKGSNDKLLSSAAFSCLPVAMKGSNSKLLSSVRFPCLPAAAKGSNDNLLSYAESICLPAAANGFGRLLSPADRFITEPLVIPIMG